MTNLLLAADVAPARVLNGRRVLFGALVVVTIVGLLGLAAAALSAGGLDALDVLLLTLFAATLPWTVIGFWNAAIGFLVMRFSRDPVAAVFPAAGRVRDDAPVTVSVALLMCIRNEPPARVLRNLAVMLEGLSRSGAAAQFHLYVLSDTSDAAIAVEEDARFSELAVAWQGRIAITYRRRADNTGFKAGNIEDFCQRWGAAHDIAITLDADSIMPASAMLRLARIMQAESKLGIVQALVVGLPSTSAFARIFQFGMRLGMRSYTIGGAWWQGDCGPYWGHNAAVRLAPFTAHCKLPVLPGGAHVMSHDQVEAVLMRRAGYDVRVLPEEDLGWEENPPTLLEFIRRDLRWCQGNMQYWQIIGMPGLKLLSRFQLLLAILMFIGSPAWILMLIVGTAAAARNPGTLVDPHYGWWLLGVVLFMWFAPKIATVADILPRPPLRRAFGGALRLMMNVLAETFFFLLLSPVQWMSHTIQLAELVLGRKVGWGAQARDDHAVSVADAFHDLWPHMLVGWSCIAVLAMTNPAAIPVALLTAGGLALSVPLAVMTASPWFARFVLRTGIGRLPEETTKPEVLRALELPALADHA
jgi:membrane glycosyltransferase